MNKYERLHKKHLKDIINGKAISPLTADRDGCLECVGFEQSSIEDCGGKPYLDEKGIPQGCIHYPFRYGKSMFKRPMAEKDKEVARKRLAKAMLKHTRQAKLL